MQFIDLHKQYEKISEDINKRIQKVLTHKNFIMGPEITELEERLADFAKTKYAFTCSSGTDALVIPLMAYNLVATDAIFVPSFTFFASAESVNLVGATPVFIDSDNSFNMSPSCLRKAIEDVIAKGELTPKGIIAVDIFGLSSDYDAIIEIANEYNLFVLEDAAQGFGGYYKGKPNGSFGDVGATSFFPAKPLGCYGDAGAIFTDNDELAQKMRSIRVHGQGSSRYDNVCIGINGRMDTIQAAILLSKLDVFEQELQNRQEIAQMYTEQLKDYLPTPIIPKDCQSAWAQYTLMAKNDEHRKKIIQTMNSYDIPIMVYYAMPMHMQTAYKYLGYKPETLPVSLNMSQRVFSLPMHPYLSKNDVSFICEKLKIALD